MSLWKRGRQYWTDFTVAGQRYRKRLGTTNVQLAKKREREFIEKAGGGFIAVNEQGPKRLSEAIESYFAAKRMRCSPRTIELEEERISLVQKHFGDVPLSAMTALAIADFQRARHSAGTRIEPSTWTSASSRACSSPAVVGAHSLNTFTTCRNASIRSAVR